MVTEQPRILEDHTTETKWIEREHQRRNHPSCIFIWFGIDLFRHREACQLTLKMGNKPRVGKSCDWIIIWGRWEGRLATN
jgi:hypothetical protein